MGRRLGGRLVGAWRPGPYARTHGHGPIRLDAQACRAFLTSRHRDAQQGKHRRGHPPQEHPSLFHRHERPGDNRFELLPWNGLEHGAFGGIEFQPDGLGRTDALLEQQFAKLGIHRRFLQQHLDAARNGSSAAPAPRRPAADNGCSHRLSFVFLRAHRSSWFHALFDGECNRNAPQQTTTTCRLIRTASHPRPPRCPFFPSSSVPDFSPFRFQVSALSPLSHFSFLLFFFPLSPFLLAGLLDLQQANAL